MSDQFVSVPVPVDRVSEVYKLLASPPNGSPKPNAPTAGATPQPAEDWTWLAKHSSEKGEWPIEVIHRAVVESNAGQRAFFKYLSERPGKWFTTQQIAEGLGLERKDIAGGLSGFQRRRNSRYRLGTWFFAVRWDGKLASYCMDEREAAVVLEALAS